MTDRLSEKSDFLLKLGRLLGPLEAIIESPERFNDQEKAGTLARFFHDFPKLGEQFEQFCKSQPGHTYQIQLNKFLGELYALSSQLLDGQPLEQVVGPRKAQLRKAIEDIPIPTSSVILEAGSPFTAFCKLRMLCESDASESLVLCDPYVDLNVFHRYLRVVKQDVPVTIVTEQPESKATQKDKMRWNQFLDISKMFAQERGANHYRLIISPSLHDRWLVLDWEKIYALGGSAKDAASKDSFTISNVAPTDENQKLIRDLIASGEEWFGTLSQTHL